MRTLFVMEMILVSTVASDSLFEWKNTTNPVISIMRQRIALEWLYASKEPVTSMVFTRFRNSSDIKILVGKWTQEEGFKPDPFISTVLGHTIDEINGTNEKKVSLILEDPIYLDYDLQYNCRVNCGDLVPRNFSIELKALRPNWTHTEVEKRATLGKDVTFLWEYEYPYEAVAVFIRRENKSEKIELGYWYQGEFTDMDEFIKRVAIKKTPNDNKTGEKISLTLRNVTVEDFGWDYVCQLTLGDGEQLFTSTKLKERDVQWNAAPPFVYRTDSKTSTATKSLVGDRTIIILLVIVSSVISHISQD